MEFTLKYGKEYEEGQEWLSDTMFYDRKSRIIFEYKERYKAFEPVAYNAGIVDGEVVGTPIEEGSVYHHFIMYIRYSSMIVKNKGTGETELGRMLPILI